MIRVTSAPSVLLVFVACALALGLGHGLAPAVAAAAPAPVADAIGCPIVGALAGVWEAEDGSTMVRYDRTGAGELRYAFATNGRLDLVAPVVACTPQRVTICSFGRLHHMDVVVENGGDGDLLTVHHRTTDRRTTYRRVEGVPALFAPRALELPAPAPILDQRLAAVQEELGRRLDRDQAVRQVQPMDPQEMMRVDAGNTSYLIELVGEVGWIDPGRFGDEAARAAFLIVQHSGHLPLMMAALPNLRTHGQLEDFALLYDRIEIRQGGKQRYGSQLGWGEDGAMGLLPIETLAGIDELRATVGLPPLAEYLEHFDLAEPHILECAP